MTIAQDPDTQNPPAWLAAAIERRNQADADAALKRRQQASHDAETINARLLELGITPINAAYWTPGGYLVHAGLMRPYTFAGDWGATAGLHDGVVSVFVYTADDNLSPALTKHVYVSPLNGADDVLNAAYSGPPQQPAVPIDHEAKAENYLRRADSCEYGSEQERYYLDAAQVHATLANHTDRAAVADLRYRLAAIERLIVPVAEVSSGPMGLLACAVHEIARFARTPEQALELVPPEYSTILSALSH